MRVEEGLGRGGRRVEEGLGKGGRRDWVREGGGIG